jgi:hypothetical protein
VFGEHLLNFNQLQKLRKINLGFRMRPETWM